MAQYSERFTGKAAEYAQYRERYDPAIVLPLLRDWCGLDPAWQVADVGAGTGMVGDLFRFNGNPVIAIEPNAQMRAACGSLHDSDALFRVRNGSAEATGLEDASIEMIAVGRALHWFDIDSAFREFRRILKPRGWVVILACGRIEDGREENTAFKKLMQAHAGRDACLEPLLTVYLQLEKLFAGGRFHHSEVPGELRLNWNELRGLTLSLSHSPMPAAREFPAFEAELREYFDHFAQNERITMASRTWLNAGQFAS